MSSRGYVLWVCLALGCCFTLGAFWTSNLTGLIPLLGALAAVVLIVQDILLARRLRREMREWLDARVPADE